MTWRSFPDDKEAPQTPHIVPFFEQFLRQMNHPPGTLSKEVSDQILTAWKESQKPLHDWLAERNRCFDCRGHGETQFGNECDACLGDGALETMERLKKLKSFE